MAFIMSGDTASDIARLSDIRRAIRAMKDVEPMHVADDAIVEQKVSSGSYREFSGGPPLDSLRSLGALSLEVACHERILRLP